MRNAGIAQEEGAQGVWLVNHGGPGDDMLAMAIALLDANDGLWTGVNLQDSDVNDALRRLGKIARSGGHIDTGKGWRAGGTASTSAGPPSSTGVRYMRAAAWTAAVATRHVDVVTTSGAVQGKRRASRRSQRSERGAERIHSLSQAV